MALRVLFLFFALSATTAISQRSMSFTQARKTGLFDSLDQAYKGGIDTDSTKSLFKDPAAYTSAYQDFIRGLAFFLKEHQFKWGKPVRCFNKIYFSRTGRVRYFLYNFKPGQLELQQEAAFARLLAIYIKQARFGLPAPWRFAQCSPVNYEDI